ncbi:hypothetical protein Pmar_PMAR021095 [Perkinsus marinus ATCC 50983]|uniref:Uncharacterized protein n=1 Tax=Perkinsus marinus (strain ATCC 50983 / TXsc) TaxID=423536 RepID=C5KGE0_PERM5|nr:hypothetical protein Pmar_PMAR021095 [Perkinsus marinus ATCC 50983]EER16496.1 hypothetical protein Pmar_PMAR021095 [Perkinsus marinus ATCC 50983]|eukprot:XP_002784700.1 hypothetical protein Pmar_PMAR021095 [Perkinsus marinus ATCC 50983]
MVSTVDRGQPSRDQAGLQTALGFAASQLFKAGCFVGDKIDELFDALIPNETPTNLGRGSSRTSKESTVEDGEWVLVERPSRNVSPQSAASIRGK